MYEDVSKHLYDISILINNGDIKKLLGNTKELNKMISYKREEEKNRIGGIDSNKLIKDFEYMKLEFDDELVNAFNKMQKIYVLDDKYIISIDDVKKTINKIYEIFKDLNC